MIIDQIVVSFFQHKLQYFSGPYCPNWFSPSSLTHRNCSSLMPNHFIFLPLSMASLYYSDLKSLLIITCKHANMLYSESQQEREHILLFLGSTGPVWSGNFAVTQHFKTVRIKNFLKIFSILCFQFFDIVKT